MKKTLTLLILTIFFGCDKDDGYESIEIDNSPLTHAELGFELEEPETILNDIAKGSLDKNIQNVLRQMFDNFPEPAERYWEFEYLEDTDRLSKMTFYLPHYSGCEKNIFVFYYNLENLIESIVSTRTNLCNEYEVIKTYTFNYNNNGLLKSIFMDNDYFVEENYFGYYPNGKIKEIYNDHRGRGSDVNFGHQKFYYDSTFSNVTRVEHTSGTNYSYTYKYFYDNKENPYKDLFIAVSVFMPYIGPAYLSENNVTKIIEKNENNVNGNEFMNEYLFNFSNSNVLESYSDMDEEEFPYILYSTNQ